MPAHQPIIGREASYQVPALDRALTILELLAKNPEGMRMREIAETLELPANSVFRITGALEARGYLSREGDDMRYRLTMKLLSLGGGAMGGDALVEQALDVMRDLRTETGETVLLGVRSELEGVVLEQVPSNEPVKFLVDPGTHFPLHASAPGKALVAFLPIKERVALLGRMKFSRYNARTLDTRKKFGAELARVSARGYGLDCGEQIEGLHCVAAPIFSHRGRPVAALWVTGPGFRFPVRGLPAIGEKVAAAAATVSRRLGYKSI